MPLFACALACLHLAMAGQQMNKDPLVDAKAVLNSFFDRMHDAPTAKGVIEGDGAASGHRIVFRIMRPNLFVMTNPEFEVRGDGKSMVMQMKGRKEPMKFHQSEGAPFIYGFEPMTSDQKPDYVRAGKLKVGQFRGRAAYLVPIEDDRTEGPGTVTLYIDRKSLLPIGCEFANKDERKFLAYQDVVLGERMSRQEFLVGRKGSS